MSQPILFQRDGRVGEITLSRPPLNILDLAALRELNHRLDELMRDDSLQLLWLSAAGERAFCAGTAVEDHSPERAPAMLAEFHRALRSLAALPAVVVAVVRGHCLGGGMELAVCCDLVLATEDARFGQPEVDLGCFPPAAAALYPGRVGTARTLELLLSGRVLECAEAEALGFVTWRVPTAELGERRRSIEETVTAKSAAVTRRIKRAVGAARDRRFPDALAETERLYLEELLATEDAREGVTAFLAKRRPRWQHR